MASNMVTDLELESIGLELCCNVEPTSESLPSIKKAEKNFENDQKQLSKTEKIEEKKSEKVAECEKKKEI